MMERKKAHSPYTTNIQAIAVSVIFSILKQKFHII